jgi:hypothetical protein
MDITIDTKKIEVIDKSGAIPRNDGHGGFQVIDKLPLPGRESHLVGNLIDHTSFI